MRTVLIADSDAFQRQLIDMLLAVDSHRVLGFETGRSVLEYLQAHVPDLVILDYSLPDINGADLCAKMKKVKRLANVPVILVTAAHKLELVRGIASAVRANLVLAKPLGDKHLREQVLELLQVSPQAVSPEPGLPEPVQTALSQSSATAIRIDPILEQALANLTHESLITSAQVKNPNSAKPSAINNITPVPIDRGDVAPYALEVPDSSFQPSLHHSEMPHVSDTKPPLFRDLAQAKEPSHEVHTGTFQKDANAALESLLGQDETKNVNDTDTGVFEVFDDETKRDHSGNLEDKEVDRGISEQELLDSLQTPLEPNTLNTPAPEKPMLNPPPFSSEGEQAPEADASRDAESFSHEPEIYTLGDSSSALATSFEQTVSDIESELATWRSQVQQLSSENERLRATLLELETGTSLATSKSYLDMVEELEMLRRLTDIQVKQMDNLQRQNQKLMEDVQHAQERRRGLFGFLQPKNP